MHYNQQQQDTIADLQGLPPIFYLVDACQSVGQLPVNVITIHCHGLVGTGRKYLRGPRGTGFLYVSSSVSNVLWPVHSVDELLTLSTTAIEDILTLKPCEGAIRFELWESSIANRLGLGQAVDYLLDMNDRNVQMYTKIKEMATYLYTQLRNIDAIHVYRPPQCGIVTFHVSDWDSLELKMQLEDTSKLPIFDVSIVPATSTPLDSAKTGVPDLLRASVSYTNTEKEIDSFVQRLLTIIPNSSKKSQR